MSVAILAPFASLKKLSRNTVPADLLWEKNIVPAEKTSWKRQIIREAIRANVFSSLQVGYLNKKNHNQTKN